jgi:murein L,D-transpeptidase YcbB/YkuD
LKVEPFLLLLVGFALTTVAGGALAYGFQKRTWDHQHDVQSRDLVREQSLKTFEEVSVLLDKRLYRMRQVNWAARQLAPASGKSARLSAHREEYRSVVQDWNDNLSRTLALVHTYFGEPIRMRLEQDVYAHFHAINEELEEFVREVSVTERGAVRVRAVGARLNDLQHRIYSFNVVVLRALRDDLLGQNAPDGPAFSSSNPGSIRFGVEGDDVRRLQRALRDAGAQDLAVDGHFGRDTERAVLRFQHSRGLTADGVAGPVTLTELGVDN